MGHGDRRLQVLTRAERLVYLFPDGFSRDRLVADQTAGERPVFDFDSLITPDFPPEESYTFVGHLEKEPFAVEVRPRSVTIIADQFRVRRDLLLALKEYAERPRREA